MTRTERHWKPMEAELRTDTPGSEGQNPGNRLIIASFRGGILSCITENGIPVQLNYEGDGSSLVGNIYAARVQRIALNIAAAFLDIGADTNVFYSLQQRTPTVWCDGQKHDRLREGDAILVKIRKDAHKTKFPSAVSGFAEASDPELLETASHRKAPALLKRAEPYWNFLADHLSWEGGYEILTDLPRVFEELTGRQPPEEEAWRKDLPAHLKKERPTARTRNGHFPVRFYADPVLPLKALYSLETAVSSATDRRVWLKSGGYLVIDPVEAMTVIDVNTGKTDKKGSKDEIIRLTDREAAEEAMRQLRLRNLSGIILIDFIDMKAEADREELLRLLRKKAAADPGGTEIIDITKLNLVEIVRRKKGRTLAEQLGPRKNKIE